MRLLGHNEITPQVVDDMADYARAEDRQEWEEALGKPLRECLRLALLAPNADARCLVAADGLPLCMWGTHGHLDQPEVGQGWLLATPEANRHVHRIHALWNREMERIGRDYRILVAYSHPGNSTHHEWLQRFGFVLDMEVPMGSKGVVYKVFTRRMS